MDLKNELIYGEFNIRLSIFCRALQNSHRGWTTWQALVVLSEELFPRPGLVFFE